MPPKVTAAKPSTIRAAGHTERRGRVGEARAVHVQGLPARRLAQRREVGEGVDRALLRRLGDGHGPALGTVDAARLLRGDGPAQGLRIHLALGPVHQHELGAAGEELGRVALVLLHVRVGGAEHGRPGLRQAGQGQRVAGGARGHKVHSRLGPAQEVAQPLAHALHDRVGAVGHGVARVGPCERLHHARMDGPRVVGGEAHRGGRGRLGCVHVGSSTMWSSHSSSATSSSDTLQPRAETPASWTLSGSPVTSGCQRGSGRPSWRRR